MSEVSRALIKTFNQDNVTVADVRNILAQDAALSAKLLRMANSAQFGLPRGVGTLDEAITMIGMSPIRALAFGACLNDAFPTMPALEANPHTPGYRWKRELSLVGFTEGQIIGELAHRWQFPMQMAQALQRANDPLTEQAFSRLGAVVHLAALLADTPGATSEAVAELPQDVLDALDLSRDWMADNFPACESFMDITTA